MPLPMHDLVAKSQGKLIGKSHYPTKDGLYEYKNKFKTLAELAKIGNMASSTLHSRFMRSTFVSIEEAVHAPVRGRDINK